MVPKDATHVDANDAIAADRIDDDTPEEQDRGSPIRRRPLHRDRYVR
jgi:hypothetical protein